MDTDVDDYTITTLRTTIDQLKAKKAKIAELDDRIADLIVDAEKLTEAMIEAGELEDSITDMSNRYKSTSTAKCIHVRPTDIVSTQAPETSTDLADEITSSIVRSKPISSIVSLSSVPTVSTAVPLISTPLLSSVTPSASNTMSYSETLPRAPMISSSNLTSHTSTLQLMPTIPDLTSHVHVPNNSRLLKLTLPVFSGDPLNWQTFWDSFRAAVHTNPSLMDAFRNLII